jgi:uncharacterized repeat protein (TIGR03803 family)
MENRNRTSRTFLRVRPPAAVFSIVLFAWSLANAQTMWVLHRFAGSPDGEGPAATLVLDSQRNLYGTTERGGASDYGTVFKKDYDGQETVLHSFAGGSDGKYPMGGLVRDAEGNLFGTTSSGGAYNWGTIFEITGAGEESILFDFGGDTQDGFAPFSTLTADEEGNLYGTTTQGGTYSLGTVFKFSKAGKIKILHTFAGSPSDGAGVNGELWLDSDGNLYGTTYQGGSQNYGTIFKVNPNNQETILYSFTAKNDGYWPAAGVVGDGHGNIYGTTLEGGDGCGYCGIVFKISKSGAFSVVHAFTGDQDGQNPRAPLYIDSKGNLYGTTAAGGGATRGCSDIGCGTVFEINSAGNEIMLHAFNVQSDGTNPVGGLTMDSSNHLYGTTEFGGTGQGQGYGTVFELEP